MATKLPGGPIATRPLNLFWLCDCSGSMAVNGKIQSLNNAIRQVIPLMREKAAADPNSQWLMRVITFSSGAQWQLAQPTSIQEFEWTDLVADGVTDMGKAFSMLAEQLDVSQMSDRALPPVLVLISDGQPSDDYKTGLQKLMSQPWARKAVRVAIAIGHDADQEVLQKFVANPELKVLPANNPDALLHWIKVVSTTLPVAASQIPFDIPATELDNPNSRVYIPVPLLDATAIDSPNVW
jgi:uncharacterized protein YegL